MLKESLIYFLPNYAEHENNLLLLQALYMYNQQSKTTYGEYDIIGA